MGRIVEFQYQTQKKTIGISNYHSFRTSTIRLAALNFRNSDTLLLHVTDVNTLSLVQAVAVGTRALAGVSSVVGLTVTGVHALALVCDAGTHAVAGVGLLLFASMLLTLVQAVASTHAVAGVGLLLLASMLLP